MNSSSKYKTETVNGIKMLPQYVWIKGKTIVDEIISKKPEVFSFYRDTPTDFGVQKAAEQPK